MYSCTLYLTSVVDGVDGQRHAPTSLTSGKRPGTHCTVVWMDSRTSLDGCEKSRFPIGFRSSDHPARSESLYRLGYPGPQVGHSIFPVYIYTQNATHTHTHQTLSCHITTNKLHNLKKKLIKTFKFSYFNKEPTSSLKMIWMMIETCWSVF